MTMWRIAKITKMPIALSSGNERIQITFREDVTGTIDVKQTEYPLADVQDGVVLLDDIDLEFGLTHTPNDFS